MEIYIVKNGEYYEFLYECDGCVFSHSLEAPYELTDDSLFRLAVLSRPFNANQIIIKGICPRLELIAFFETSLNAKIHTRSQAENYYVPTETINLMQDRVFLSFSGGFDSLAAKYLLGDLAQLISIQFGGSLSRESDFFFRFDPKVFKWSLRGKRSGSQPIFKENIDWRFMLAPACTGDIDSQNRIVSSGSILEASPFWFSAKPKKTQKIYSNFGFGPGITLINPVSPLSEFGTTAIVYKSSPDELVNDSLKSLADETSFKNFRKRSLLAAVSETPPPLNDGRKHKFGSALADDFLALYFIWKFGPDWTESNFAEGARSSTRKINMRFVERYNKNNLNVYDDESRNCIESRYHDYDIFPYDTNDLLNHEEVCQVLKV